MIKIQSAEIENFRSIVGEPLSIYFDDLVVIVGPNNSGKSNILRALQLFFSGGVEGSPYTTESDYPKSDTLSPKAQTKITVTIKYDPSKDVNVRKSLDELEKDSDQTRLGDNLVRLRLSFSKNGVESWQFLGQKGARNIKKDLIHKVRDAVIQSVICLLYTSPSPRDS